MINLARRMRQDSNKRGAALILEIIIYLVIVALIAVAVISGVRAVQNLVFTMHAKKDIAQVHIYMEGKYATDRVYSDLYYANNDVAKEINLTQVGNGKNVAKVVTQNGSNAGYCIAITSATISGDKKLFWSASDNPSRIMQRGTKTADSLGSGPFDSLCYLPVDTYIGEG